MISKLIIIGLCIAINNNCFAITNNHNNKYDLNTICTSTQYMIDNNPNLIKDEKKVMQLNRNLCNPKSQDSIVFNWSINQQISNKLSNNRQMLFIDEFREVIDSLVGSNIGKLPINADEVKNFNTVLTKFTLNILLNKMVGNNINIKEHNLLLLNNKKDNINSILGNNFCNDIKDLGVMKYRNKKCSFKITNKYNAFYYTVSLQ